MGKKFIKVTYITFLNTIAKSIRGQIQQLGIGSLVLNHSCSNFAIEKGRRIKKIINKKNTIAKKR